MRRILAAFVISLAALTPATADAHRTGDDCMKWIEAPSGFAYSVCYNIEPYRKQRIRVVLINIFTHDKVVRFGPWITQNRLESIRAWNVYKFLFYSARVVVVYA